MRCRRQTKGPTFPALPSRSRLARKKDVWPIEKFLRPCQPRGGQQKSAPQTPWGRTERRRRQLTMRSLALCRGNKCQDAATKASSTLRRQPTPDACCPKDEKRSLEGSNRKSVDHSGSAEADS